MKKRKIFYKIKELEAFIEANRKERELTQSFHAFVKAAWPIIEGNKPFIDNWSVGALCEHLEAVHRLQIRKLKILVPPRTSKSTIATICWPVWTWLDIPTLQYFCVSHSDRLVKKHAIQSRDIITSDWFKVRWGNLFSIKPDQNTQNRYVNTQLGFRESTGILSKFIGSGGQRIIIDDPNDPNEFESQRIKVNEKYGSGLATRINNPNEAVWVLIQQRTNERDLSGYTEDEGDWVTLCLPMEFESSRRCITVPLPSTNDEPWQDPRTYDGELLWPERFNQDYIEQMKVKLGQYHYASQFQQRPAPEEGGILKKSYFQWWKSKQAPNIDHVIQSWDTGMEAKEINNYSACTTWGVFDDENFIKNVILLSAWRGKVEYPKLRKYAKRLYYDYRDRLDCESDAAPSNSRYIPDVVLVEAKVSGIPLVQDLRDAGIDAVRFNPNKHGNKVKRVELISHFFENGRVWVPAQPPHYDRLLPFADEFVEACALFPNGDSKDYVDSMSQAMIRLWKSGLIKNTNDDNYAWDDYAS